MPKANHMRWTCPKCGKKLDISNEQLIANDGVIVCPQCLLQARQPIPKKRSTTASGDSSTTPPPRKVSQAANTPPPHKTRMKQASTSYRYTGPGSGSNGTTRIKSTKKKSKKKKQDGMSAWGCFGKSIVFTLVLFALYVFFGLLLESFQ